MGIDGIKKTTSRVKVRKTQPTVTVMQRAKKRTMVRMDSVRPMDIARKTKRLRSKYVTPLFAPIAPHRLLQHSYLVQRKVKRVRKIFKRMQRRLGQPVVLRHGIAAAVLFVGCASFGGGMYAEWSSRTSQANAEVSIDKVLGSAAFVGPAQDISPDQAVQTFVQLLDEEKSGGPAITDQYEVRKDKLRSYLATKRSPLAQDDKALDALLHAKNMRMILAISHVESNFARHCADNNCSGIGVEPGNPAWRKYKGLANWVLDFDSLLERRYKNWTPEQMIGKYVVPGSSNWEHGVKQVLTELNKADIK